MAAPNVSKLSRHLSRVSHLKILVNLRLKSRPLSSTSVLCHQVNEICSDLVDKGLYHQSKAERTKVFGGELLPSAGAKNCNNVKSKAENKVSKASKYKSKIIKYPLMGMGNMESSFTQHYDTCKQFLESLSISTEELQYFPDIQEMSHTNILECIERLKQYEIKKIFSLFLIQRTFLELNLEKTAIKTPLSNRKQWFKLRNGMYRLIYIRDVMIYQELCRLLEDPYLDPNLLLERLAAIGIFDHLQTVTRKTKDLRSIGATPSDLMNNLDLYSGSTQFNLKIKLYQHKIGFLKATFPVQLFLTSSISLFKEKLHIDKEVDEVAKLLNVKGEDFLKCWGFKQLHLKSLVYKIQMCLQANIPKTEIFNYIGILDRITLDQCHRVTLSLRHSGQPGSVFVLKAMETSLHQKGGDNTSFSDWDFDSVCSKLINPEATFINSTDASSRDMNSKVNTENIQSTRRAPETDESELIIDNIVDDVICMNDNDNSYVNNNNDDQVIHDNKSTSQLALFTNEIKTKSKGTKINRKSSSSARSAPKNKATQSSKVWRMEVFKLIAHLLQLDKATQSTMYRADINIDPTQLIDVTRNLDFLLSQHYSKQELSQVPIVLAHPHETVVGGERNLELFVKESIQAGFTSKPKITPNNLNECSLNNSSSLSLPLSSSSILSLPLSSSSLFESHQVSQFSSASFSTEQTELESCNNDTSLTDQDNSRLIISKDDTTINQVDNSGDFLLVRLSSDRVLRLNVLQYLLEKETNFSLSYAHTQVVTEFLN